MKVRLMMVREEPAKKVSLSSPDAVFRFLAKEARGGRSRGKSQR